MISGYLITTILIEDIGGGRFSILTFYERRARRILPALFAVMAASMVGAAIWMLPSQIRDFSESLVAVLFFVSNILFWREEGYFSPAAELKPLLHSWSLAVEEQYYLVFPLVLAALWRFGQSRVALLIGAAATASLLLSEWGWRNVPNANFYLAPTRAWELLAGSLCAFLHAGGKRRSGEAAGLVGLALILLAIFAYDDTTPFPSLYTLAPVGGTVLIILFAGERILVARLLSLPPLVAVGLISYSAYLWHQPLFAFARIQSMTEPPQAVMLALALLSLALAWITWRLIEQPFRGRTPALLPTRRGIFLASDLIGAVIAAIGAAGHLTDGYDSLWRRAHPDLGPGLALIETARTAHFTPDGDCVFSVPRIDAGAAERIAACRRRRGPGVLVLGDSHAIDLFGIVAQQPGEPFVVAVTQGGCRPHDPGTGCQYEGVLAHLAGHPDQFAFAVYEQAGFYLLSPDGTAEGTRKMFAAYRIDAPVPRYPVNGRNVALVRAYLEKLGRHVPVLWFGPRLEPHIPLETILRRGCDAAFALRPGLAENFAALEAEILRTLGGTDIRHLSQNALLDYRFPRDFGTCEELYWSDGDHLSLAGERMLGGRVRLVHAMRRALVDRPDTDAPPDL